MVPRPAPLLLYLSNISLFTIQGVPNLSYVAPEGGLVMQKLVFGSGDVVTATMMSQTIRGTYKVDGKDVIINLNGQQQVFTIDGKGCLDSGGVLGKLCKS